MEIFFLVMAPSKGDDLDFLLGKKIYHDCFFSSLSYYHQVFYHDISLPNLLEILHSSSYEVEFVD